MMKGSSKIKKYHEQEILECEGIEELATIKSLLNDDESTLIFVNEKLEIAMKQLSSRKELLFDLEYSLGILPGALERCDECMYTNTSLMVETEKLLQESISLIKPSSNSILALLANFHQMIQEFEVSII